MPTWTACVAKVKVDRNSGMVKVTDLYVELDCGTVVHPDGALAQDEDAGVVLMCSVGAIDELWQLARLDFDGGSLWTRDPGLGVGTALRVHVPARDVGVALSELPGTSISNQLPGVVHSIGPDAQAAQALALVQVSTVQLLARLTRRSVHRLQLQAGSKVWLQVKSVALLD